MRAISLIQPWASLWLMGPKVHETRAFRVSHRGWLLVHASKNTEKHVPDEVHVIAARVLGGRWFKTVTRGALLGAVYVEDCAPTGMTAKHVDAEDLLCGDFTAGRWAWRRSARTIQFEQPIPLRGKQGVFHVEQALVPEVPHGN